MLSVKSRFKITVVIIQLKLHDKSFYTLEEHGIMLVLTRFYQDLGSEILTVA